MFNPLEPFYGLNNSKNEYAKGPLDILSVFQWVVILFILRDYTIRYLLEPIANTVVPSKSNLREHKLNLIRFTEQSWTAMYYIFFWSWGLSLLLKAPYSPLRKSDWTSEFWKHYPHLYMTKSEKLYYLTQAAFYVQQVFVLNIEKRRKDHWQMFAHHCITISLIVISYITNYTRVGQAILTTMDNADIFLAGAKVFKYAGYEKLCDITFVLFMLSWVFTRQYIFGKIIYSVWVDAPIYVEHIWNPSIGQYYSDGLHKLFLALLLGLQVILFFWLVLIIKVVIKFVRSNNVEDIRSDSEEDDLSEDNDQKDQKESESFNEMMSTSSSSTASNTNTNEFRKR